MFFSPIDRWILIHFYGYDWKPCFMKKWLVEKGVEVCGQIKKDLSDRSFSV